MPSAARLSRCAVSQQAVSAPLLAPSLFVTAEQTAQVQQFFTKTATFDDGGHTNNWAVLVCASKFWFNYRVRQSSALSNSSIHPPPPDTHAPLSLQAHGQHTRHVQNGKAFGHTRQSHHPHAGRRCCVQRPQSQSRLRLGRSRQSSGLVRRQRRSRLQRLRSYC